MITLIKLLILNLIFLMTTLPAAAGNKTQQLPIKRRPASFTQGFKMVSKKCGIKSAPKKNIKPIFYVESGKRLWLTAMDSEWMIAKTKNNQKELYIHSSCTL